MNVWLRRAAEEDGRGKTAFQKRLFPSSDEKYFFLFSLRCSGTFPLSLTLKNATWDYIRSAAATDSVVLCAKIAFLT